MGHRKQLVRSGFLGAVVATSMLVAPASAQTPPAKPHKVIKLDEISVEGRIQKPQAFYILPRSSLNYSALDQQETLLPKIKKALQKEPF